MVKKKGMAVCDPHKAFPVIASMVDDKDPATRKSALSVIGCVLNVRFVLLATEAKAPQRSVCFGWRTGLVVHGQTRCEDSNTGGGAVATYAGFLEDCPNA